MRRGHIILSMAMRALVLVILLPLATAGAETVSVYSKFETCVSLGRHYPNPFNYSEVAVRAVFAGPAGSATVDGFYYQAYQRSEESSQEVLTAVGEPQWCVRYCPLQEGTFTVQVTVSDVNGTRPVQNTSFQAVKDPHYGGFIRKSSNGIHFQFDNRSTYYPVGENVCWVSKKGTYDYDSYFSKLSEVGGNYARLWLTDSGWDDLAVETAVANMSLPNTWRLDYVVQLAETKGLRLLMCTESFNYFCTKSSAPCDWDSCYYNRRLGGFLDKPQDFFTDERARSDYKQRLRYLVARYGYSTAVFAWEFFNEVDITDGYNTDVQVAWINEMSAHLHSVDVNSHLISTSYSNSDGDQRVQALPALDFTMTHNYGSSDIAQQTAQYPYKKLMQYKKPSYVAEFGIGNENDDKAGVSLHNGLWAPLFSLGAGTCMTWWWDSWVEPNGLYHVFPAFAEFVSQLPLAEHHWVRAKASTNVSAVRVWSVGVEGGGNMVLGWLQDTCFTWSAQHSGVQCRQQSSVAVQMAECSEGTSYSGTWYSTTVSGAVMARSTVQCSGGTLEDTAPPFTADIAVIYSKQ